MTEALAAITQGGVDAASLGAAVLPPAEFGGTVSEAMFLGSEKHEGEPGTFIDDKTVDISGVENVLYQALHKK